MTEEERELDWLRWFHDNADFGPADGDVRDALKEAYAADHEELPEEVLQCPGCGTVRTVTREKVTIPATTYRREREVVQVTFVCAGCDRDAAGEAP